MQYVPRAFRVDASTTRPNFDNFALLISMIIIIDFALFHYFNVFDDCHGALSVH